MAGMDLPEYLKGKDVKKEDALEVKEDKPKGN